MLLAAQAQRSLRVVKPASKTALSGPPGRLSTSIFLSQSFRARHTLSQHLLFRSFETPDSSLQRSPLCGHQLRRFASDNATQGKQRGRATRYLYRFFAYSGFFLITSFGLVAAFFIYDASTYAHDSQAEDIPVAERALNPQRGGPKNLPIADVFFDDHDSQAKMDQKDKPKLVILGTGWGSVALLKSLNPGDYHVTVVSPVNYFLFTPMLPSATVGTLGLRSLVEPVRLVVRHVRGHFLRAEAVDVDMSQKLVEVSQVSRDGKTHNFYLPYDKLVVAVGMPFEQNPMAGYSC